MHFLEGGEGGWETEGQRERGAVTQRETEGGREGREGDR